MEEYHLGRDQIALHEDLIDLAGPVRAWRISEIGIEDNVLALLSQSRRGIDLGFGIGALPFHKKQMVKRIGSNNVRYVTESIHLSRKISVSCIGDQMKRRPSDNLITAIRVGSEIRLRLRRVHPRSRRRDRMASACGGLVMERRHLCFANYGGYKPTRSGNVLAGPFWLTQPLPPLKCK